MIQYMPYVWTFVLIMSVLIEAATATLTTIWFMPAGFISLILSIFEVSIPVQIVTYVAIGALMLVLSRTVFKKKFSAAEKTPTNADRIIGETAVVTSEINNDSLTGEVNVRGQYWTARSVSGDVIPVGAKVTVQRIEGVKVMVTLKNT